MHKILVDKIESLIFRTGTNTENERTRLLSQLLQMHDGKSFVLYLPYNPEPGDVIFLGNLHLEFGMDIPVGENLAETHAAFVKKVNQHSVSHLLVISPFQSNSAFLYSGTPIDPTETFVHPENTISPIN